MNPCLADQINVAEQDILLSLDKGVPKEEIKVWLDIWISLMRRDQQDLVRSYLTQLYDL